MVVDAALRLRWCESCVHIHGLSEEELYSGVVGLASVVL